MKVKKGKRRNWRTYLVIGLVAVGIVAVPVVGAAADQGPVTNPNAIKTSGWPAVPVVKQVAACGCLLSALVCGTKNLILRGLGNKKAVAPVGAVAANSAQRTAEAAVTGLTFWNGNAYFSGGVCNVTNLGNDTYKSLSALPF